METLFDIFSLLSHQSVKLAINATWLGLALTGLAWFLLRWTGRAAAGARVGLWWGMLVIVLALPLLAISPPDTRWAAGNDRSYVPTGPVEYRVADKTGAADQTVTANPNRAINPARTQPRTPLVTSLATESMDDRSPLALRLMPLPLFLLWLSGLFVLSARLGLAYRRMTTIKARSESFDIDHLPLVGRLLDRSHRRRVEVRLTRDAAIPTAAGLGRPLILIPHRLAETLSDTELEAVILHELAHLNRWDDWSKLAQKLIEAVCFFHPAIHIIGHQLELERELACDEWAIAQTGKADRYTRCLTRLVQLTTGSATTLIPGALSSRKQIFRRFERLLIQSDQALSPRRAGLKFAALIAVVGAAALVAVQVVPAIDLPIRPVTFAELQGLDEQDKENQKNQKNEPGKTGATELEEAEAVPTARSVIAARETAPTGTIGTAYVDGDKIYGATTQTRGQTVTTTYNADDVEITLTIRGEVELSKDTRSVQRLSRGAGLEFVQRKDSEERRLLIEPGPGRDLDCTYSVDNQIREFDRKAQDWFAETLEYFVAKTGFGAEARLRGMLTENSLQYCLRFIEDDVESHAQRYYYEQLMAFDHLGFRDLRRIKRHARKTLEDQYDSRHILEVADKRIAYMREYSRNELSPEEAAEVALSRSAEYSDSWSTDYDNSWSSEYVSDDLTSTYVGSQWSRSRRDRDTEGEWEARYNRSRNRLGLEIEDYDGDYRIGFPVSPADLEGLTAQQITAGADEVAFSYQRGSGTFHFTGEFGRRRGRGEFTFEADPEYVEAVKALGYRTSRLSDWRLFELAIHDVSLEYIQAMSEQGLGRLRLSKLVEMRIHDIEPEFVAEFAALGYDDLSADDLIAFAIHDVDLGFVRELSDLNVRGLDQEAIVQLSIHDIDADFVREFAEIGYDGLSTDQLVQFGIHDVDPELVRELKALNVRGLDENAMVQLSIHDIDADFVHEFAEIGYDGLSTDQLVQFGIHGVDPDLVKELTALGIRGLDEDAFVQLTIHGIDAGFVRDFVEIGYDRLSADRLVEFGIHDVTARYVKALAELGYDDLSPSRLVEMKIHDVTPSFIRRLQKRGYDDLSPAELVEARIQGCF